MGGGGVACLLLLWLSRASSAELLHGNTSSALDHLDELLGLSELPMDRLLMVKRSFDQDLEDEDEVEVEDVPEDGQPEALALTASRTRKRPQQATRRGAEIEHPWDPSKKSSISSIFTTTITALAFIAFGAYLIALVVYAIRNQNQFNGVVNSTANPVGGLVLYQTLGARPVIGRRRRRREVVATPAVVWRQEDMYRALVMMAEGYALYHTSAVKRN